MATKVTNVNVLQLDGATETVGTPAISVLQRSPAGDVLLAQGATLPTDADAGYAVGCIFLKTNGGVGTVLYVNEGTASSADFNALAGAGFTTALVGANGTIFPQVNPATGTVVAVTGDTTLVAADLNKIYTNGGAGGTVVLSLPAVAGLAGKLLKVQLLAAQIVRVLPVSGEAIALGGSAVVTKYLNIAAVIGNMVDIYCDGTRWMVVNYSGVVTKEA